MKLLLVLALAVLALPLPANAAGPPNAADLEAELVCPTCRTTLDQSSSPVAQRMKAFIRARIAQGWSQEQIKDALVAQFGRDVLATPPKEGFGLLAWLVPLLVGAGAAVVVTLLVREWSHRRAAAPGDAQPLDPQLERLVDEELARFDA